MRRVLCLAAALAAGCAATPAPQATAADCAAIAEQAAAAEQSRRAAQEQQQSAWKAVVPFAVAARYANGKSAAGDAERQLDDLQQQATRLGCTGG